MTLALAIIGIAIGLASFAWTIHKDRQNTAAREREERRRDEEIAALRTQLDRQEAEARDDQAANLVATNTGHSGSDRGVSFPIKVRNTGPAVARDVTVWLALDTPGGGAPKDASHMTANHNLDALVPGDDPATFSLEQPGPFDGGKVPRAGLIVAAWADGNGRHTETIGKLNVFV